MFELTRRELIMTAYAMGAVITLPGCTNSPQATGLDPIYRRKEVQYDTREKPGTIVINPSEHFLYFVEGGGHAVRYGVGVGSEGFAWSGVARVRSKQEWPNWYPTNDYLQRQPAARSRLNTCRADREWWLDLPIHLAPARCICGKETKTPSIGFTAPTNLGPSAENVSSGCIRLTNEDVIDLYDRTSVGAKVVVL